MKDGEEFLVD